MNVDCIQSAERAIMQVALQDKEREMFEAVKSLGPGWHDRGEIAEQLGKNKLNPADTTLLDLLVSAGSLEKELQPGEQPHISRWVYRVKG